MRLPVPRSCTADRSDGEPATDRDLEALGLTAAIPRKAKVSPACRDAEVHGVPRLSSGTPAPMAGSAWRRRAAGSHPAGRPRRSRDLVRAR